MIGVYFLYAGIVLAGFATISCCAPLISTIGSNTHKYITICLWTLALILIVAGIIITRVEESYCCNNRYAQIFNTPMNQVRDPDQTEIENVDTILNSRRNTSYTANKYDRFGRRNNYASQRYQYAY